MKPHEYSVSSLPLKRKILYVCLLVATFGTVVGYFINTLEEAFGSKIFLIGATPTLISLGYMLVDRVILSKKIGKMIGVPSINGIWFGEVSRFVKEDGGNKRFARCAIMQVTQTSGEILVQPHTHDTHSYSTSASFTVTDEDSAALEYMYSCQRSVTDDVSERHLGACVIIMNFSGGKLASMRGRYFTELAERLRGDIEFRNVAQAEHCSIQSSKAGFRPCPNETWCAPFRDKHSPS